MLIVSGKIYIRSGERKNFLAASAYSVSRAREAPGCQDFVVAADPIEPNRVNVYEEWDSEEEMLTFRDSGPSDNMNTMIEKAAVLKHVVASCAPA